jgi:hypothetical protein
MRQLMETNAVCGHPPPSSLHKDVKTFHSLCKTTLHLIDKQLNPDIRKLMLIVKPSSKVYTLESGLSTQLWKNLRAYLLKESKPSIRKLMYIHGHSNVQSQLSTAHSKAGLVLRNTEASTESESNFRCFLAPTPCVLYGFAQVCTICVYSLNSCGGSAHSVIHKTCRLLGMCAWGECLALCLLALTAVAVVHICF